MLNWGKYRIPLQSADIRLLRKGLPFWKILGDQGIFSSVIRVPITFPAEKFYGIQLSAMCVPDLRGTQGMFSYYTTASGGNGQSDAGQHFCVTREGRLIKGELVGPQNPLLKSGSSLKCPFVAEVNGGGSVGLKVDGKTIKLIPGEYSDWTRIVFKAPLGIKISGICRFLLKSAEPEFKLYVTPINIDPENRDYGTRIIQIKNAPKKRKISVIIFFNRCNQKSVPLYSLNNSTFPQLPFSPCLDILTSKNC